MRIPEALGTQVVEEGRFGFLAGALGFSVRFFYSVVSGSFSVVYEYEIVVLE